MSMLGTDIPGIGYRRHIGVAELRMGYLGGSPYLQHRVATLLVQHGRPTPSEPSHKKPFFEVSSFSALFGPGCCCQLVCFEFGVLHFHLPLYTRNGQVGEHVILFNCGFWLWSWLVDVVTFVCFEFVVLHYFLLPIPETDIL